MGSNSNDFLFQLEQCRMEQIRRVAEIHNLPPHLLKTIELNLRKDMYEVEKVRSDHSCDHSTNS